MRHPILIISLLLIGIVSHSQVQFPSGTPQAVKSLLDKVYQKHVENDTVGIRATLVEFDELLAPVKKQYPLFTGVTKLYQSYYAIDKDTTRYLKEALSLLRGSKQVLVDSFPGIFYQLIQLFHEVNRMTEWMSVDSVLRESANETNSAGRNRYAIATYADKKLKEKQYFISKNLAQYDQLFFEYQNPTDEFGRITIIYNEWLALKGDYEQWADMPFQKRNISTYRENGGWSPGSSEDKPEYEWLREIDFNEKFSSLISKIKNLREQLVDSNKYGTKSFNRNYRVGYYTTYIDIISTYYDWAVRDYKQSAVILPLKEFLFRDLLPKETEAAAKFGETPVLNGITLGNLYANLSNLYYSIGNGEEAREISRLGQVYIESYKKFSTNEKVVSLINLMNCVVRALRIEGKFAEAYRTLKILKKYTHRPDSLTNKTLTQFEHYAQVRIEEIYTLSAQHRDDDAIDTLSHLLTSLDSVKLESEDFFYNGTATWTNLQFLVATQKAIRGKWMTNIISESVGDLENKRTHLDIFYPTQLLQLKAIWHTSKRFSPSSLSNLLFYTGRQLQDNFILLTPEDRMHLYEQRLSSYFDVYHELLFSGKLDSFPELKEKVIAQSLYLKNSLVDGNILPDEYLFGGSKNEERREIAEQARALRQETNIRLHRAKIRNLNTIGVKDNRDQFQSVWLSVLKGAGMDSLIRLPDWKRLSLQLKPGQLYMEIIRYTSWLSDSSAKYGAYLISADGKLRIISMFREDSLTKLLRDPSSSPQTSSLNDGVNRGAKVGKTKPGKKFQNGDKDKLGQLILAPIWKYIVTSKEILVVPDGLLNRISLAALQWQNKYLLQYMQLRQLSGSYMLSATKVPLPIKAKVLLSGGLDYSTTPGYYNSNRLFTPELSWQYLPGTKEEIQMIQPLFKNAGHTVTVSVGNSFPDSLRQELEGYQFIHLATHGFYFDTTLASKYYSGRWSSEAVRYEPLYRCGIALSSANNPDSAGSPETDGYLLGFEIANTDLRKSYLVSLSACETGLGDVRNNLGVDGLARALKLGGARHLLISLWKVPDQPTAVFMQLFYKELFAGKTPAAALQSTQLTMSKSYKATDWAAFILVE